MNHSSLPPSQDFPDSAEGWLARLLSPESTASDHAAFEQWLAASADNPIQYAEIERIHRLAGRLAGPRAVPRSYRHVASANTARRRPHVGLAWAAAVLLAIGATFWLWPYVVPVAPVVYATTTGEQRDIGLADGSHLLLDTNTSVEVRYQHSQRRIDLLNGRLRANVAADASRPFVIFCGAGSIKAIGTVFEVEHWNEETLVRLLEGRIAIDTADADAGPKVDLKPMQQQRYDQRGQLGTAESFEPGVANAWTTGRLVFKQRRLADLLVETNRYTRKPLTLAKPELGDIRVSGVFEATDQDSLLQALRLGWGLQARAMSNGSIQLESIRGDSH